MESEKRRLSEITRFLAAGASTTVFSYVLYLSFLYISVPYIVAYPVSFVVGIVWSYFINTYFVFRRRPTLPGLAAFPLVYIGQLVLGTAIVHVAISKFGTPEWSAPLIAIIITLPFTYICSRWLIGRTSAPLGGSLDDCDSEKDKSRRSHAN